MNWFLFGAAAGAAGADPGAGDRMMSGLIYCVSFFLPLMPLVFTAAEKRGYQAVPLRSGPS